MLSCLNSAIGLTRSDNTCIINGLSSEELATLRASESGLYLDEIEGGLSWQAVKGIDTAKGYYQQVTQARNNAIMSLEADLVTAISLRYTTGKKRFAGTIGQKAMTASLNIAANWQGIRIRPNDNTDALLSIRRITAAFNTTGTISYYLIRIPYGSEDGEIVRTWAGNTVTANTWSEVSGFTAQQNGFIEGNVLYDYYLVYNRTQIVGGNAQAKNNTMVCDCHGAEAQKPGQFATVEGVSFDAVQDGMSLQISNLVVDTFAHGLLVDMEILCSSSGLICKQYADKDELRFMINYMIIYKAQYNLIKAVLNSNETNRYTTMSKDLLLDNMKIFEHKYTSPINWIVENIDVTQSGCYTCREQPNQPRKRTIML